MHAHCALALCSHKGQFVLCPLNSTHDTFRPYNKRVQPFAMTNINVLKYTAALCNALVENYMVQQIESCKRTLQSKPKSKVTKERLEMLEAGLSKVNFFFETGRKYHKIQQMDSNGERTTHCFVDKETGQVFKPASHKSPNKTVRYDLSNDESRALCFQRADWSGDYLTA